MKRDSVDSDEVLLQCIRGGDIAAFDRLYERYEARLFAYLRAMVGDAGDAEEVLHDAFLTTLRDKDAVLDREGAFRAWLYRVARNLALNRRRATGRRERAVASVHASGLGGSTLATSASDGPPDGALETRELEAALAAAVRRLPDGMGELWQLRTSGLSYEQIATVVGAPLGTIKSRMHQLVSVLREELKPWIAPE